MHDSTIVPESLVACGSRHDTSPAEALRLVRSFDGPVLLDLDETLYLRNSTEDFIDTAWPGFAAYAVLRVVETVKPWRWIGGEATRDNWRIGTTMALFPWTMVLWRRRARALSAEFANADLVDEARSRAGPLAIVTAGFRPVVLPLAAELGLAGTPVVSARPFVPADRRTGKLHMALRDLGGPCVGASLVVTDSVDDLPLLDRAARGARTIWPAARYRPAFSAVYYPGRYLSSVKRPGTSYIRRNILQDDFLIWILCSLPLAGAPVLHLAGLFLLLVSFWAVYEQGYVDNDLVGARHEDNPRLSAGFHRSELARRTAAPWLWAAICGLGGIALTLPPGGSFVQGAALWSAALAATYIVFLVFNRVDKATRVWPFAALQFARGAAFAAVLPAVPVAVAAIGAYVVEKWIPYFVYRLPGQPVAPSRSGGGAAAVLEPWTLPLHTIRLVFFAILAALVAGISGVQALLAWPTLALFGLMAFRARKELSALAGQASWIARRR
ncbi:HAD family hydrolase [Acuticoccus sediminis]|uniref:HAD family hydrolase n=1 Tax=Acuticoccus sediminis TaxID=2184697 RepID=UPI001391EAFF|nr:HAD family hydrolase [Acuticoccus sediminis]